MIPDAPPDFPESSRAAPRTGLRRALRIGLQSLAFLIGLGLLAWCIHVALRPENQAQLRKLVDADPRDATLLVVLSLGVLVTNGLLFWVMLVPVRRLNPLHAVAVNTLCTLLALVPFKPSLILRVLHHHRRDGVPLLTIGAWFAAIAAVTLLTITPLITANLVRGRIDARWWAIAIGGSALGLGGLLVVGRFFADGPGWRWIESVWRRLPLPSRWTLPADTASESAKPPLLERLHEFLRMVSHPWAVLACAGFRLVDVALQASRFQVSAGILARPISWDESLLAGTTYLFIGAVAPTGQLGFREAGTAGVIGSLGARGPDQPTIDFSAFTVITLMVTAAELALLLVLVLPVAAYLRPDRIFRAGTDRSLAHDLPPKA